ncbi:MAG: PHB depolymerase family esterase [Rhodospirillales bacterium]|nr:PHB depolymerase family esterase [Rhodospirillales bacterium]
MDCVTPRISAASVLLGLLFLALALFTLVAGGRAAAGELRAGPGVEGYSSLYYLPGGHDGAVAAPLVVALHGCRQDAADFARGTAFNELADAEGFVVLYPETPRPWLYDPLNPRHCWVWWDRANQSRGAGEPAVILAMIEALKQEVALDEARIYVAGLSSGGAMSVILGSLYPEVFAVAGVHSGLEFAAAAEDAPPWYLAAFAYFLDYIQMALAAMSEGGPDPDGQGDLAFQEQGPTHRVLPAIVVQGSADTTVAPLNADQVVRQLAQMNDHADDGDGANDSFDAVADLTDSTPAEPGRHAYATHSYRDGADRVALQSIMVEGLGHAWSGGSPEGSYTDPQGPDASRLMWEFFKARSLAGP